jgi:hypothetical protein
VYLPLWFSYFHLAKLLQIVLYWPLLAAPLLCMFVTRDTRHEAPIVAGLRA